MLTAVVLTKNEERNIEDCLKAVSFCDDILVVDTGSTDKTIDVARKNGATVISYDFKQDFAAIRNFALEKAITDWILFIDADERVSPALQKEITAALTSDSNIQAYSLRRRDWFWGTELKWGETHAARTQGIIRLIKKGSGRFEGTVHEEFREIRGSGEIGRLKNYLEHYPHPSITDFLNSINMYSTIRAQELRKKGVSVSSFDIFAYPFGKFIYTYFLKLGFLDGPAGFVYSFMMAFHSFLVRGKLATLRLEVHEPKL